MQDWPHAPVHRLGEAGAFMVTAGTYLKANYFADPQKLTLLQETLIDLAGKHGWHLQAWAVFSNHYHFVAISPENADSLVLFIRQLHSITAREINRLDSVQGRKVWHNYWDKHLTFERSYLGRLNYVHWNPVRHGLTAIPQEYSWCSAAWFERTADRPFFQTVTRMKSDTVSVPDDFSPTVAS